MRSRARGASNRRRIHHGPRHRVHGTPDGAALLAADDPAHPTVFTPLARPTVFTPSIPLTVCVMRLRHAVFTPSTPLAVGVLRVRRACEGGEPKQTARSVATGAPHRLCAPAQKVAWPRPACTLTKAPPSPPCPIASLARGIVVRVTLEVILRSPQEPPPPKPLSPRVLAAS